MTYNFPVQFTPMKHSLPSVITVSTCITRLEYSAFFTKFLQINYSGHRNVLNFSHFPEAELCRQVCTSTFSIIFSTLPQHEGRKKSVMNLVHRWKIQCSYANPKSPNRKASTLWGAEKNESEIYILQHSKIGGADARRAAGERFGDVQPTKILMWKVCQSARPHADY